MSAGPGVSLGAWFALENRRSSSQVGCVRVAVVKAAVPSVRDKGILGCSSPTLSPLPAT